MLIGTFLVGAASAAGYQARFAAIDLATDESRAKQLSFVVWASTIGAVAGPNLMQPAGNFAENIGLPRLVGPYLISAITLATAAIVIALFLKPDPFLLANKNISIEIFLLASKKGAGFKNRAIVIALFLKPDPFLLANKNISIEIKKGSTKAALSHIYRNPKALFAISAIAIGHIAMVSVMVMTPVHMAHVDVTLSVIGFVISVHVLGMYAFSPIVGSLSDRLGRVRVIQIGLAILLLSALISGFAQASDAYTLGVGLFLLGLGWSCTLIAGSALLSESVEATFKASSQGASDLVMNLAGAGGGAIAGVIIGTLSYGWLCFAAAVPVGLLAVASLKLKSSSV
jgi:MFS family permease